MSFIVVGNIIGGYPLVAGILLNQQALLVQEIIGLPGCKASVIQYLVLGMASAIPLTAWLG